MKKLSFIVMAGLLALGLAQCKKNDPSNNVDDGDRVSITLELDNGGQKVHPEEENGLAYIVYDKGDILYVGSNGKYMGCLTYNGTLFTGSINAAAIEGQPLQFIFMGGQAIDGLTENSSTECIFNIGDQSNDLAVISCGPSNENFSATNLSYSATLRNKCALVKFDLGSLSTDAAISLTGMKTEATVGFNGTVTNGTATGDIVTYGTGSTRYAVVLSDQEAVTEGTISAEDYEGTFSIPTAASTNAFLTDATITAISPLAVPLTIEALSDGNIQVNIGGTLSTGMKYSVNNGAKALITTTTDINVNAGDKVQFYGNGTSTQVYGNYPTVKLQGSAQTKVYGNIMSLIDEGNYASCTTLPNQEYVFSGLFWGNVNLTDASGLLLPATTLAPNCYASMFRGCSSLQTAPELLPATTLAPYCYASMFRGCSSLQTAPELLPAPELAPNCYYYMFYGCTSLTTVPALPATMLAEKCYYYMFRDCTSLQTVPSDLLPATTLANECYSNMFNSCWSLTTAPTLPATTLAPNCYASMFRGCSSLQTAPELLPAPELAPNCYYYMFYGCTSLTTVPALPATMLANSCYAYMFQDCKGLQTVPSDLLSTTTLAYSCYSCMFYGCSSLTTAPTLPATTLADECYYRMFENCSQLNSITCLATSFGSNSTMYWVSGVASSGTFTKAAGASWPTGNHGIPTGWTVVTPVVPVPEGAINGLFTVNDNGTKVYFSKGSLQYIGSASTPYWKFADNQWDLLSTTNQNTNNTNVDRDIFCWGTSGYAHGATFYQPWEHGSNNNQFYAYGDIANYLSASTGKADWGYNAISNGGNQEHLWYTLDKDEWTYLLINRPGSTVNGTDNARYARATVEGINGVILFPDIYTHPADVNQPNYINSNSGGWANTYTAADFMKMEAHGAVFLPAGGGYVGGNIVNRNAAVFYWSSQPDNGNALGLYLNNNSINCANSMYRHLGLGVRLVKDVQ